MKLFGIAWLWVWTSLGYAQDALEQVAAVAAPSGTALTLGGSDLTFPVALVVCTGMLARWTPRVHIVLSDKRTTES